MSKTGGLNEMQIVTDHKKFESDLGVTSSQLLDSIIKDKTNAEECELIFISYKTQVVAGIMYYIKIGITRNNEKSFVHVKLFKPLCKEQNVEILDTKQAKRDEEIYYF